MNAQDFKGTEANNDGCSRSRLVFAALVDVPNRYQLCQFTAKGARRMHAASDRMQDTVNAVLRILDRASLRNLVPSAHQHVRVPSVSHWPYASGSAISKTVFVQEERNFSHV
jgi:hypothetical protein